jgi:hypothetical protein
MFWFLIRCKAATLMMIWKKVAWKAWALLLFFFAQAVHNTSVSHSQFDKHLIMPRISQQHPLCVAVMHPKKNTCLLRPSPWVLCPWLGLSHRLQVKTDASGNPTAYILIQFQVSYWRYWKNGPQLLFVSQQDV